MTNINIFFYDKLKEVELINKISNNNVVKDGAIFIHSYDKKTNTLLLGDQADSRNEILQGKLVTFHLSLGQLFDKINNIEEIRIPSKGISKGPSKQKYIIEIIDVTPYSIENNENKNGIKEKAYIIY